MTRLRCLLLAFCFTVHAIIPVCAQKITGGISGVVTDPSGAVVPNAVVAVTDLRTNSRRTAVTDASGVYSVPELNPTSYRVSVEAANFKEAVIASVEVHVATIVTVSVSLQIGQTSETVRVEGSVQQVQTDSAELGEVIDSTQVSELPLNGRNFIALTQLAPGVSTGRYFESTAKGLKGGVDFSVNGNSVANNLYLVDGANNNDRGSNRSVLTYPSLDSIQEFKVLQNAYGPEFGQAAGAVITMVTKSGTNQLHGGLSYYGRNDYLNAYDYFSKRNNTGKAELRYHDFGFHIGGPAIKDKLFFFYNQEWNKEIRGVSNTACVPSDAERAGDFLNPSCFMNKPVDGEGNSLIVPALRDPINPLKLKFVSKVGQDFIDWFPRANHGDSTWAYSDPAHLNWRQENVRIDFNIKKDHVLMARYAQDNWVNPNSDGYIWGDSFFPTLNSNWEQPSKMIIGKLTSTIGSSLINDVEFSYSSNRINVTVGGDNPSLLDAFTEDIPTLFPITLKNSKKGIPVLNGGWGGFQGYAGWSIGGQFWLQAPWNNALDMYTVRDDISKVSGNHLFKAGFLATFNAKNEDSNSASTEHLWFSTSDVTNIPGDPSNVSTGNDLLNVMEQGLIFNTAENSANIRALARWRDYEAYVGDTWKARKNLTVEYGIRWSLLLSPYQANNKVSGFNPSLYDTSVPFSAADSCNGMWTAPGTTPCEDANASFGTHYGRSVAGPNKYLRNQNFHLFAPRLGLSWDPTGKGHWAVRAGLGQFFQRDRVGPSFTIMNQAPFSVRVENIPRALDGTQSVALTDAGAFPTGGISTTADMPNSWQWNVAVERQLAKGTYLQMAYVGNSAIHQTIAYDINAPDPTKRIDCNLQLSGATFATSFGSQPAWVCGSFRMGNTEQGQPNYNRLLRPYSNYGALSYWDQNGQATYHSLQLLFKGRYKRSQFTAAYTWSHSIGNVELDDANGGAGTESFLYYKLARLDRGNTGVNRPQVFTANGIYFLPELKYSKKIVRNIFGGWELSGITTAQSGHSLTVQQGLAEDLTQLGSVRLSDPTTGQTVDSYGTYGASSFLGNLSFGMTSGSRTGVNCNSGTAGTEILNAQAFTLVGQKIGYISRDRAPRGYCFGASYFNTDLSIEKNWKVGEKLEVQLRIDMFDALNHPNMETNSLSGSPLKDVNCGAPDADGLYQPCSPTNNTITRQTYQEFGDATQTVGRRGREMQYGLRIRF